MTYRQVAVVCEGQTEEAFVRRVLQAPAALQDVYLDPVIVKTSRPAGRPAFKGGGSWRGYADELRRVLRSSHYVLVTTMIDTYAYPVDAPGADLRGQDPYEVATAREHAIAADLPGARGRFLPHLLVHEMETLVIAAAVHAGHLLGDAAAAAELAQVVRSFDGDPHLVDGGRATAPSKRLLDVYPRYSKVTDGVDVILDAGLQAVLDSCPRFDAWWRRVLGQEDGPIVRTR